MNYFKLLFLGIGLFVFCCNQIAKDKSSAEATGSSTITDEKHELQKLMKQLYKWYDTEGFKNEFEPVADSTNQQYIGLDYKLHNERLNELTQTDFFTEEFLGNYHKIALTIDEKLKKNKEEWLVGELPPFGNDASPWCNCQDTPIHYWDAITIDDVVFTNNTATFTWTWGEWGTNDFKYHIKAVKNNDIWKIEYMEGFEYSKFFH